MLYYSEITNKKYPTMEACQKAEKEAIEAQEKAKMAEEKRTAERKELAAKVEDARQKMIAAQHEYQEALSTFVKKYGTYHLSLTGKDAEKAIPSLFDILNPFMFDC